MSGTTVDIDTDFVTLTCPDDFVAIRVGFTNINPTAYKITIVIATASSTLGDFANPTGDAHWTPLTFAGAGAAINSVVCAVGAPTAITVRGANGVDVCSGNAVPQWTWTDWTPLRSKRRTDLPEAARAVMIRVLFPTDCFHTRPNGGFLDYNRSPDINCGFNYVAGHVPADVVSTPRTIIATASCLGHSNPPVSCVQFLTANEGIVAMTTGDSHHQGTSTSAQFSNYLLRATVELGARHVGTIPFGYWTTAQGGSDSDRFLASLTQVLPVAKPSFVVLPGWSYNDMNGATHADQTAVDKFEARLMMAAESCKNAGAETIFLTPFPRNPSAMTPVQVGPWQRLRDSILALRESGAIVIDAAAMFGRSSNGRLDGTYLSRLSDDDAHPNNEAHAALSARLIPIVNELCGIRAAPASRADPDKRLLAN